MLGLACETTQIVDSLRVERSGVDRHPHRATWLVSMPAVGESALAGEVCDFREHGIQDT
jgi:hypothetical protein